MFSELMNIMKTRKEIEFDYMKKMDKLNDLIKKFIVNYE